MGREIPTQGEKGGNLLQFCDQKVIYNMNQNTQPTPPYGSQNQRHPQEPQYQGQQNQPPYQQPPYQQPPHPGGPNQPGYPPAYPGQPNQPSYQQQQNYPPPYPPEYFASPQPVHAPRRKMGCCSCALSSILGVLLALILVVGVYFLAPFRTNLLVLGIDRVPEGTSLGRSDTMIMMSVVPLRPDVAMLSIPRDLWVTIPGVGENRINTAHFFAENEREGSGPLAAVRTVEENFGVEIPYYVRVRFDAFQFIVDALGGVRVNLPQPMAGLPAGEHMLDGTQALAFVRDRSGTDDFFRMEHTQFLIRAIARQMLMPESWPRLPDVIQSASFTVDTNIPVWQWPRLGLAFARSGVDGIDSRTIQRDMVTPFTTDGGAQVLRPEWDRITPVVNQLFK
jgi:polyisoprenyl-teichoic acid--peptidoglycan teichoic acid transferase